MITIDWKTFIISVPKADMALVQSNPIEIRELDLNTFRLILKGIEDDPEGMGFPKTHDHVAPFTVGGVTLARAVKLLDPYTVTFENGTYAVNLVGANSNVADKVNLNYVSVRSANSAGLITVVSGSGVTEQDKEDIADLVWTTTGADEVNSKLDAIPTSGVIAATVWENPTASGINEKLDALPDATEITTTVWNDSEVDNINAKLDAIPPSGMLATLIMNSVWVTSPVGAQVAIDSAISAEAADEARIAASNAAIAALAAEVAANNAADAAVTALVSAEMVRKCWQNKLELVPGTTNNWVLYDDDSVTPLLTWDVTGPNGEAIIIPVGAAAKRTKAH